MEKCICCFTEQGINGFGVQLREEIYDKCCFLAEEKGVNEFWTGRDSKFQRMCAKVVDKVKLCHEGISNTLVVPYFVQNTYGELTEYLKLYDNIVTSPIVYNSPVKLRVIMCNRFMQNSADYIISCTSEIAGESSGKAPRDEHRTSVKVLELNISK